MRKIEELSIETADQYIRLARAGRGMVANLEVMGNNLMARAVELDTLAGEMTSNRLPAARRRPNKFHR